MLQIAALKHKRCVTCILITGDSAMEVHQDQDLSNIKDALFNTFPPSYEEIHAPEIISRNGRELHGQTAMSIIQFLLRPRVSGKAFNILCTP